jgi:hypothetical protein
MNSKHIPCKVGFMLIPEPFGLLLTIHVPEGISSLKIREEESRPDPAYIEVSENIP